MEAGSRIAGRAGGCNIRCKSEVDPKAKPEDETADEGWRLSSKARPDGWQPMKVGSQSEGRTVECGESMMSRGLGSRAKSEGRPETQVEG